MLAIFPLRSFLALSTVELIIILILTAVWTIVGFTFIKKEEKKKKSSHRTKT